MEEDRSESIFLKTKTGDDINEDIQSVFRKKTGEDSENKPQLPYDVLVDKKDRVIIKKGYEVNEWKKIKPSDKEIKLF